MTQHANIWTHSYPLLRPQGLNMPYKSDAQRKWAHTPAGEKALGGPKKVAEWDKASKGKKLPEIAPKKGKGNK